MAEALWLAIAAAVSSFVVTQVLIPVLPRLGLVSAPDPNHPSPVPVGGGIALWIVSGAGLWVMALLGHPNATGMQFFCGDFAHRGHVGSPIIKERTDNLGWAE